MPASSPMLDRRVLREVAVGGAVGALLRVGAVAAVGTVAGGDPLPGVVLVNLLGAALLGRLLARSLHDPTWRGRGPLLGTGLLGAFTTYSGLVVPLALLIEAGAPYAAAAWGVGSLVAGVCLGGLGLRSAPA